MRFFTAVLSVLSIAAAVNAVEYDNEIESEYESMGSLRSGIGSGRINLMDSDIMLPAARYGSRVRAPVRRTIPRRIRREEQEEESSSSNQELEMMLGAISKFDRIKVEADRIGNYEVSPSMDFDNSRSLNIKMTPIANFQKQALVSLPTTPAGGNKIMMHLLSLGIKPSTVKNYLHLKRQGLVAPQVSPVKYMLRLQRQYDINLATSPITEERAFISSPVMSSTAWNINQPISSSSSTLFTGIPTGFTTAPAYTTETAVYGVGSSSTPGMMMSSSPLLSSDVQHGVVLPSVAFANTLREGGVVVSTTTTGQPAVEIKHLQDCLLQCEKLEWRTPTCTQLKEFAADFLSESSEQREQLPTHSRILGLTSPQIMRNLPLENVFINTDSNIASDYNLQQ